MLNPTLSNFTRSPFIIFGVVFTLLVSLLGLISPLIGPYNPLDQQLRLRHEPPLSTGTALDRTQTPPAEEERFYVLGTDHLGRDVLSRLIASYKFYAYTGLLAWGVGTGLAWLLIALQGGPAKAAASATARSFPLGILNASTLTLAGIILGISYLLAWSYIRVLLLVFEEGPAPMPINMLLFAGIMSALIPASLHYQSLRQTPPDGGSSPPSRGNWGWLMVRQTLLLAPVSVSLAVLISLFIEFPWSFIGFGVQPPQSSLALLISQGRQYMVTAWWVVYIPLALMVIAIGAFFAIAVPLSRWQNRAMHPARHGGGVPASTELAPRLERMGAFLIDLILLWLLNTVVPIILSFLVILLIYIIQNSMLINWLLTSGSQIVAYVLIIAYFPFFWAISGQTPGMKVFGLKVVRSDGNPVSSPRAVLRLIGLAASAAALFLGLIWVFFDVRRQGWHDKIADTLVVQVEATDLQRAGSAGAR